MSDLDPSAEEFQAPVAGAILVVEDEAMVRSLVRSILQMHGYRVLEADSPAAAERIAGEHAGPIPLVITDVVMPGMSGSELAARLQEARPGLRVLYMSGYTDDAVIRHGVSAAAMSFLQKPFRPQELAQKVRELLG